MHRLDAVNPADYIVSIDVYDDNPIIQHAADANGIDITTGSWVYFFDDQKVYRAKKSSKKQLAIYENDEIIGMINYSAKRFLWHEYNAQNSMKWKGESFRLGKIDQAFIYPSTYQSKP